MQRFAGRFLGEKGTVEMNLTAAEHLLKTSRDQGVGVEVPTFLKNMLEWTVAAGHGSDGYMSVIENIKTSERERDRHSP